MADLENWSTCDLEGMARMLHTHGKKPEECPLCRLKDEILDEIDRRKVNPGEL